MTKTSPNKALETLINKDCLVICMEGYVEKLQCPIIVLEFLEFEVSSFGRRGRKLPFATAASGLPSLTINIESMILCFGLKN